VRSKSRQLSICLSLLILPASERGSAQQTRTTSIRVNGDCSLPADLRKSIETESAARYNSAGAWFAARRRWTCAVSEFERALELKEDSWDANYNLGLAQDQLHRYKEAEAHLRRALQLKPDSAQAHIALGRTLQSLLDYAGAETEFRAAVTLSPISIAALDELAQLLSSQRRYTAAISYWNRALALAPHDPNIEMSIAIAYLRNDEPEQSITLLKSLIRQNPGSAQAHFELATIYANERQYRSAADEYAQALTLNPQDTGARLSMVKSLVLLERYEEALDPASRYVIEQPEDFEGHYLLGTVYRGLRNYIDAEIELRKAIAINPNNSDLQYNFGFVLARTGKPDQAITHLQRAIDLDPKSDPPWLMMAEARRLLHQYDLEREAFETVRRRKQQHVNEDVMQAEREKANNLLRSGEVHKAIEIYRHLIEQQRNDAHTYYNLAIALEKAGDRGEERAVLNKALALNPHFAPALNQIGMLDAAEGRPGDAEKELKAATENNPQFAEAQNNLGVLYGRRGDLAGAEQMFRLAVENDPSYTQAYVNLGLTLAQRGDFAAAQAQLEEALRLDPKNIAGSGALKTVLEEKNSPPRVLHERQ
jgi:tetratricopeptide (TPR) repeat protein